MENLREIMDLTELKEALKTPYNRIELINLINEHSKEEFNIDEVWELAVETESQLASRVQSIIDYYKSEEEEDETEEETKKDLFEFYEDQPEELKELLSHYESFEELDYEELRAMRAECEKIGYTFDFYLDAQPYDLRKL